MFVLKTSAFILLDSTGVGGGEPDKDRDSERKGEEIKKYKEQGGVDEGTHTDIKRGGLFPQFRLFTALSKFRASVAAHISGNPKQNKLFICLMKRLYLPPILDYWKLLNSISTYK